MFSFLSKRFFRPTSLLKMPRVFSPSRIKRRTIDPEFNKELIGKNVEALYDTSSHFEETPIEQTSSAVIETTGNISLQLSLSNIQEFLEKETGSKGDLFHLSKDYGMEAESMIIVEMTSARGRLAVGERLIQAFKKNFEGHSLRREGLTPDSDWTIIDLGIVIVHIMSPEARKEYTLEENWTREQVDVVDEVELSQKLRPKWISQDPSRLARLEEDEDRS